MSNKLTVNGHNMHVYDDNVIHAGRDYFNYDSPPQFIKPNLTYNERGLGKRYWELRWSDEDGNITLQGFKHKTKALKAFQDRIAKYMSWDDHYTNYQ